MWVLQFRYCLNPETRLHKFHLGWAVVGAVAKVVEEAVGKVVAERTAGSGQPGAADAVLARCQAGFVHPVVTVEAKSVAEGVQAATAAETYDSRSFKATAYDLLDCH